MELEHRLAVDEPWSLTRGPIIEKSFLDLRSFVCEPMQYGRVYLAGDAAHIISPAGGKGMNLAFADAAVFVEGVRAFYQHNDDTLLAAYSQRCLSRVWRAQEFSHWMLSIMNPPPIQVTLTLRSCTDSRSHDWSACGHRERRQPASPRTTSDPT